MAMNRQQKRLLQKQGQLGADGEPQAARRSAPPPTPVERVGPVAFAREVRGELRKVAWPNRTEVANYSVVVLVAIVILTSIISGLDFVLGEAVLRLFER